MADELVVLLDVLADDENDFFGDEENDLILFAAACTFAKRNLNRMQGFFEQTIPTYSLDEFKAISICRGQPLRLLQGDHGHRKYSHWKPVWKTCD